MKPLWLKLNYLPRGVKKFPLPRCYLWSFTGGRFFGLVVLFMSASVYSRVLVCLPWFELVCLHKRTNSVRLMTSNKPNRSYSSCVFWAALEGPSFCRTGSLARHLCASAMPVFGSLRFVFCFCLARSCVVSLVFAFSCSFWGCLVWFVLVSLFWVRLGSFWIWSARFWV